MSIKVLYSKHCYNPMKYTSYLHFLDDEMETQRIEVS